jgi:NitT/TauT family transport system substrate-binding protein
MRIRVLACGLGLLTLTAACGGTSSGVQGADGQLAELRVMGGGASPEGVLQWVAADLGYNKDEGIKVDYTEQNDGAAIAAALVGGSIEFGGTVTMATFPYMMKDVPIVAIRPLMGLSMQIIVGNDVPTPHQGTQWPEPALDLKGLKVGIRGVGALAHVFAADAARDAGLDPDKDVTWVSIADPAASLAAFKTGRIDALVTFPPVPALIGEGNYKTLVDGISDNVGSKYDGFITTMMFGMKKWVDAHPKQTLGFCTSIARARAFVTDSANLDKVAAVIEAHSDLTPDQSRSLAEVTSKLPVSQKLTEELWKRQSIYQLTPELKAFEPPYQESVYQPCVDVGESQ